MWVVTAQLPMLLEVSKCCTRGKSEDSLACRQWQCNTSVRGSTLALIPKADVTSSPEILKINMIKNKTNLSSLWTWTIFLGTAGDGSDGNPESTLFEGSITFDTNNAEANTEFQIPFLLCMEKENNANSEFSIPLVFLYHAILLNQKALRMKIICQFCFLI